MKFLSLIFAVLLGANLAQADVLFDCRDIAGNDRDVITTVDSNTGDLLYFFNGPTKRNGHSSRVFFGPSSSDKLSIHESADVFIILYKKQHKFSLEKKYVHINKNTGLGFYEWTSTTKEFGEDVLRRDNISHCTDRR